MNYTTKQASEILGVHITTIMHMIYRGELKAFKVGRVWRINENEIKRITGEESAR